MYVKYSMGAINVLARKKSFWKELAKLGITWAVIEGASELGKRAARKAFDALLPSKAQEDDCMSCDECMTALEQNGEDTYICPDCGTEFEIEK